MSRFVARCRFDVPAQDLFAWHARPGAVERLMPPWERVTVESREGGIEDGLVVFRLAAPVGSLRWVARHRDFVPGRSFTDEQVRGPFARWVHRHTVEDDGPRASRLTDHVEYELPFGFLGAVGGGLVRRRLRALFEFRHRRTAHDLARHAAVGGRPRLRVAVTGSGGFLGRATCAFLTTGGHEVVPLVRDAARAGVRWDPATGDLDSERLEGLDAVVHLAGAGIADRRWTRARKETLRSSRVDATQGLARALARLARPPRVLVAASAVGVYGDRGDEELDDEAVPGAGFLADLGRAWEAATTPAETAGIRVVRLRFGVVLGAGGGALQRMRPAFRAGVGGPVGGGTAWWPWVSHDDAVAAIHHALFCEGLAGSVNVVAPTPVRQADFARTLGRVLRRPAFVPMPRAVARAAFGEMAGAVLLASQRVRPTRLLESGFRFAWPDLEAALAFELGRSPPGATEFSEA